MRNTAELGAYGGVYVPAEGHELFDPETTAGTTPQELNAAAGTVGGRVGFLPSRFLGLEVEGGAAPSHTVDDRRATLWHVRGSVVGQVGLWSVVPFGLAGVGGLGVSSDALGRDVDATFHFGAGVKINANARVQIRVDARDVLAARRGVADGVTHNGEFLVGAAVRLGRNPAPASSPPPSPGPGDRDSDGFLDPDDACPDRPGVAPDGCPVLDSDADGLLDPEDSCPDVPGPAPTGCPPLDRDRDGFLDDDDACPDQPGVEPDGCPLKDTDGDGFLDPDDACPEQAENRNGFEDDDGCPDELPDEVKSFDGIIDGIYFDVDRATIRPRSRPVLERAVSVLQRYPGLRIEISGHTDTTGDYEHNLQLSMERAAAVEEYMVVRGVDDDRISIRGAGPDEPIADNATKRGRQQNRRIEFRVLGQ
ncbi:MAG: OmpA family protein [Myxococcales bacterium]|nr:OmpA family protein [Myxococcales bacterium]